MDKEKLLAKLREERTIVLDGAKVYQLWATYGLPLEVVRDVLNEHNQRVEESWLKVIEQE
jgi:alanyl-tRNA synthetase